MALWLIILHRPISFAAGGLHTSITFLPKDAFGMGGCLPLADRLIMSLHTHHLLIWDTHVAVEVLAKQHFEQ